MSTPRETELKLEFEASDLAALSEHPLLGGDEREARLTSVYFDTEDRRLREAGFTLRVRRDGDRHVQTVKAAGTGAGLFDRPEWEWPVDGAEPDLARLGETPAGDVLGRKSVLRPLFSAGVERSTRVIARGGSRIEVALDRGRITLLDGEGDRVAPIHELELELKDGSAADLFGLAREIGASVPLRLGVMTKAERGYSLLAGRLDRASKAEPVRLDPEASAGEAFQAVAHACLRHMRLNEAVLLDHRDADALHQLRVSLRRLRSAFSLFGDLVEDHRTPTIRAELRRLGEPFGQARNLDVFLASTLPAERARRPDEAGLLRLESHLEGERSRAYEAVGAVLRGEEWRLFLLDLIAWIDAGPWREAGAPQAARRDGPARAFATEELERRRRQVKKRGRHLDELDPEARHRVRIAAKKLRYGAEFFGSLYPKPKAVKRHRTFVKALADLQDCLGDLNDIATAHTLTAALTEGAADSAVFAAGLTAADMEERTARLLRAAAEAHAALIDVRPFWR
ncbi:CHAD domain containing protein [Methylobacterium sp. 4-46]|uniref:CYTH and CHAD domain-containing protein n=1 Tax=unclassified Methylobacterium TaxID=2615210 RepID=UPI000152CCC6|nr:MULTISPECIES: CHAD domain-containing protein [Methylobacterium]ACA17322.1 CHAD domain containing protein [Methylobacterium sp. 4-46]WFT83007.1 CHAD domain-containing protein [Methylobacterium nodulans]